LVVGRVDVDDEEEEAGVVGCDHVGGSIETCTTMCPVTGSKSWVGLEYERQTPSLSAAVHVHWRLPAHSHTPGPYSSTC